MYWKLAIQNIRRSLRDYIIYLVTLTLTAALMYSFLALGFSSDVLAMAENMSMLTTGILLMSALVAFMSSFVIGYAIVNATISPDGKICGNRNTSYTGQYASSFRRKYRTAKDSTEFVPC